MIRLRQIGRNDFDERDLSSISFRILLTYGDNNEVTLAGKGTGGLTELKGQLSSNQVYFGVSRVRAVDDHGSKRAKFVFITYVGTDVVSTIKTFFR